MKDVSELIYECVEKLHTYNDTIHVGNRPHYPMYMMFNEIFDDAKFAEIYKKLKRFWPSAIGHELFYRYIPGDEDFKLEKYCNDSESLSPVTSSDVEADVRDVAMQRDIHAELIRWWLINIIDTKGMQVSDDFKRSYDYLPEFKEISGNQTLSLLVVLLRDEKSTGEDTAYHIRKFLSEQYQSDSENIKYDAVVIVSDLRSDNTRMTEVEMLSALSNIIIVSDNDAVSDWDDKYYAERALTLSGEKIYSIAYRHLERPNEMISKQICDIILSAAKEDSAKPVNENDLLKMIGISNGKIDFAESMIGKLSEIINADFLNALPMKEGAVQIDLNPDETPFCTIKEYLADASVIDFLVEAEVQSGTAEKIIETVCEHISKGLRNLPLSFWESNADCKINGVPFANTLDFGRVSEQLNIKDYFLSLLAKKIREGISGRLSGIIEDVRHKALLTRPILDETLRKFNEIRPIQGYDDLGKQYKNITDSFVMSQLSNSESMIHNIAYPGNTEKEIISNVKKCFDQIVITNSNGVFSKSFNEEWEMRLEQSSDLIYRKIQDELEGSINNNICLKGIFSCNTRLRIYLLHTFDASGNNETSLYKYLHQAFINTDNVQYINTGFDDELDAVLFVEIKPEDLALGCS